MIKMTVTTRSRVFITSMLVFFVAACLITPGLSQLNVASIGNWGFESSQRLQVVETLKKTAESSKLTFIVSPGSNFEEGVSGLDDPAWKKYFDEPFTTENGELEIPFFTVLGMGDWSGEYESLIKRTEVDYSDHSGIQKSPKWTLPNWWYHYIVNFSDSEGASFIKSGRKDMSAIFIFIDTWILSQTFPYHEVTNKAWKDLETTLQNAEKVVDYIVVVGDKSLYSSGPSKGDSYLRYYLLPLFQKYKIDAYISGFDRSLEIIKDGDMTHITCGSGSIGTSNEVSQAKGSVYYSGDPGFCVYSFGAEGLTTKLIDGISGETLFEYSQKIQIREAKSELSTAASHSFFSQIPEVKFFHVPAMVPLTGKDTFVRIVGTIGLGITVVFGLIGFFIFTSKISK